MNAAALEQIVNATLYEGYLLYPYRASSKKNCRERFTFGRVYPPGCDGENSFMQAQCLVKAGADASLEVSVLFLQPTARGQGQEAVERRADIAGIGFNDGAARETSFDFGAVRGTLAVRVEKQAGGAWRITARVENRSEWTPGEELLPRLLASTHVVFAVANGEFVSLMDPPAELKADAAQCKNVGVWPVLIGDESKGERDTMLASPIILYDYPKIAPESAGPLFDGTEIDEILTLRVLTLTDDEKSEMRRVDAQARKLLERTESLSNESLLKMHGMMKPAEGAPVEFDDFFGANRVLEQVRVGDSYLRRGDRVRLHPKGRADVMDMALAGKIAIVEALEQDLEQRIHVAVVLESDPGRDLGLLRQPGHRFFYSTEEVEPITEGAA